MTVAVPNSMSLPKILTSWPVGRVALSVPDSLGVVSRVLPPLAMVTAGTSLSFWMLLMVAVKVTGVGGVGGVGGELMVIV